jgi:hypothetical protein
VSAVLAAALTAALVFRGLVFTPDGWAYWEGGVSLLSGHGYAYFGGQPIRAFPPLFSVVIALASAVFSVSGATLALLLVLTSAATAFVWASMFVSWCGGRRSAARWKMAIALWTALTVGFWCQSLLADTLGLALIGIVSWAVARAATPAPAGRALTALAGSLAALVVTRHAGLALVPAAALVALVSAWRTPVSRRLGILVATVVVPLAIAWLTSAAFGELHTRVVALGVARYTPGDYVAQIVNGWADLVAHPVLRAGKWVVAIAMALAFMAALGRLALSGGEAARQALAVAILALLATACTAILFNLTWVHDELRGRFLWPLPLVALGTMAVAASRSTPGHSRGLAVVTALVIVLAAGRAGVGVARVFRSQLAVDVTPSTTLRVDHVEQPAVAIGHQTLISPPDYPWIDRHPAPGRLSDH